MRKLLKCATASAAILSVLIIVIGIVSVYYVLIPYQNRRVHKIQKDNLVQINSFDGTALVGELIKGKNNNHNWAILIHSYRTDHTVMYRFGKRYSDFGYHVLYPDNRAHGNSDGRFIGMGYLDRLDLLEWVRYILSQDKEADIILHGLSMGASTALMFTGLHNDELDHVKAVIADCGFASAESYLSGKLKQRFHLPSFPVIPIANVAFKIAAGYYMKDASAVDAVRESTVPTLIIHGDQDLSVSVDDAYNLYNASRIKKELLIINGAGHGQCLNIDPINYWKHIINFIIS